MVSDFSGEIARQIERNKQWSLGLVAAGLANAALVAVGVAYVAGTGAGIITFLVILGWVAVAFLIFESLVMKGTGARLSTSAEAARLEPIVFRLSQEMDMTPPRIFVMEEDAPNAFAIGSTPGRSSITFTTALLRVLNDEELEGVAAHELSHIANQDSRISALSIALLGWALFISGVAAVVAFAIGVWGVGIMSGGGDRDWSAVLAGICVGILMICAAVTLFFVGQTWVLIARLAHMGFSRQREWLADATAVRLTRKPEALANALEQIATFDTTLSKGTLAQSLCLAGPTRKRNWWENLLESHPDIEKRIERLRSLAATGGFDG